MVTYGKCIFWSFDEVMLVKMMTRDCITAGEAGEGE